MKRKSEYRSGNNKKFVTTNPNSAGTFYPNSGMSYNAMIQSAYNMSGGEMGQGNALHHAYYPNYTNMQYIVDPNQDVAYYQTIPPHIATGMYHQPPPPPLPPDDSCMVKPPLPPGQPPTGFSSPPQTNWNRAHNQRIPNTSSNRYNRFQKKQNDPVASSQLAKSAQMAITTISTDPDKSIEEITVSKKAKRKPMSTRYTRKKEWDRDDAMKALAVENEFNQSQKLPMLILKFPDPELNKDIVKSFSKHIDNVHFQQPSTARYCYVTLRSGTNVNEVEHEIASIPFGNGKVIVKKHNHDERTEVTPEEIDPYTLYIGNLPTNITVAAVKEKFPTAQRIDIGFAQKMKYTRYAFIRYQTIEESIEAFRKTFNLEIESRSLIVRFRRQKGNVGLPGETRLPKIKLPATANMSATLSDFNGTTVGLAKSDPPQPQQTTTENCFSTESTTDTIVIAASNSISEQPSLNTPQLPFGPSTSNDSKGNVIVGQNPRIISASVEVPNTSTAAMATPSASTFFSMGTVKIKQEVITNDEVFDESIIGSRIKHEPEDYEEEHEYNEDDSDDDDDEYGMDDKEEDDEDADLYARFNMFHETEFNDVEEREEKPNIHTLRLLPLQNMAPCGSEESDQPIIQKKCDYDDLFAKLNPDDNLEL